MRVKLFSFISMLFLMFGVVLCNTSAVKAQEGESTIIDEVIAQVNDDVITLSMLKRENRERIEALKQERKMTDQQANDDVLKHQPELIATLINERLLLQKGKELDLASEIESEVNRRMLDIAREQGINSIEKLEIAMRGSGLDPNSVRETMRTEMMKQAVLQQEVDRRIYLNLTAKEVKDYFEAHKDLFLKPETVDLSEILLVVNDKDEAAVKARATELVTQLRAGADFKAVASANSEREKDGVRTAPKDGGHVGNFDIPSLREDLQAMIKPLKAGQVSDPIKTNEGYQILRVNERTAGGSTPTFNDNIVRQAILAERQSKERDDYMVNLRNEAFIKVSESYRASVEPLLKIKVPAAAKTTDKDKKKKQ